MKTPVIILLLIVAAALVTAASYAAPPAAAQAYRGILTREAHFVAGLDAPIPMYAAQIEQESGWRPGITAWDNGRGLAQFMDGTTDTIVRLSPDLGRGDPYNPTWAIRALIRYDAWLTARVAGDDSCQRRAAALKAYNAGLGHVLRAQQSSPRVGQWFGVTEYEPTKQSAKNWEYSRMYPRWVIFKRQPGYASWGAYTCAGMMP